MRQRTVWFKLVALVLALFTMVGSAAASVDTNKFKEPHATDFRAGSTAMVMDAEGTAHITYTNNGIVYQTIPKGGTISAPRTIVADDVTFDDSALAVDASGLLHLVWRVGGPEALLRYATLKDGTLSAPLTVATTTATDGHPAAMPLLQVEANGRAHIVWKTILQVPHPGADDTYLQRVKHATVSQGLLGATTVVAEIDARSYRRLNPMGFGVAANGVATVVYSRRQPPNEDDPWVPLPGSDDFTWLRTIAPDGTLGAPVSLGNVGADRLGDATSVLVAADGTTHVLWWAENQPGDTWVFYSLITPGGTLLRDRAEIARRAPNQAQAALDSQGRLHLLIESGPRPSGQPQVVRRMLTYDLYGAGRRLAHKIIYSNTGELRGYRIAVGPSGRPTIVWSFDKASSTLPADVYAIRPGVRTKRNISREAPTDDYLRALAVDPQGGAVALWNAYPFPYSEQGIKEIYASTYD